MEYQNKEKLCQVGCTVRCFTSTGFFNKYVLIRFKQWPVPYGLITNKTIT
jgi:hypothetical protein